MGNAGHLRNLAEQHCLICVHLLMRSHDYHQCVWRWLHWIGNMMDTSDVLCWKTVLMELFIFPPRRAFKMDLQQNRKTVAQSQMKKSPYKTGFPKLIHLKSQQHTKRIDKWQGHRKLGEKNGFPSLVKSYDWENVFSCSSIKRRISSSKLLTENVALLRRQFGYLLGFLKKYA